MSKVIALASQNGGVGKTTTALNLDIGLARQLKKVLLIDADAQGNLTDSLGWNEPDKLTVTLATIISNVIMEEQIGPDEGILHHKDGIDLMPANIELSDMEVSLVNTMSREIVLRNYLNDVKGKCDYVLIDCMPSLNVITVNALVVRRQCNHSHAGALSPSKGHDAAFTNHQPHEKERQSKPQNRERFAHYGG